MGGRGGELVEAIVATQWEGICVPGNKATIESRDAFYWAPRSYIRNANRTEVSQLLVKSPGVSYWTEPQLKPVTGQGCRTVGNERRQFKMDLH